MNIRAVLQPQTQLGNEFDELLREDLTCHRIVFVSAFVALRTVLRLRGHLLRQRQLGAQLCIIAGIDLRGTSREVLEELLRWNCETFVFHNALPRATFHPKIYLFERPTAATLFIGSNNLTDGGLYTNYEAGVRCDFALPADAAEFERLTASLQPFLELQGPTVRRVTENLIQTLVARGELPTEAEARMRRRIQSEATRGGDVILPESPFSAVATPLAPLLPNVLRREEPAMAAPHPAAQPGRTPASPSSRPAPNAASALPRGTLVWRKTLPRTDALQVNEGSHHVGGVRLTQAEFELHGRRIDQTTYFRQLFADYPWERERRGHEDQEHTFVPMRIVIRGRDYGVWAFEISHKPSGEAGERNYTTILRWGREFNSTIASENLTGTVFSLYETADAGADFLIEITDAPPA